MTSSGLHVVYLIPSLNRSGGAEQAVVALAGPYAARGIRLDVATFTGQNDLAGDIERAGATVVQIDGRSIRDLAGNVRALVRDRKPDLVHTTLFDADVAGRVGARWAGVPVVSSLVNVAYGPEQRSNSALRRWKVEVARRADQVTARLACRFHALSTHVATTMGERLSIPSDRIDVIPRGRDLSLLGTVTGSRRADARKLIGVADDQRLVLALARHEFQKGLDVLVRSWPDVRSEVPDAVLRIGGRAGGQSALIDGLTAEVGLNVAEVDIGVRDDVADLLCAADALVVPSRWEGLGSILIEAMAMGTPVVTTATGPIPDVVGTGWARVVPPEDPAALARAVIATVRQSPDERRHRGEIAQLRFAASFTIAATADAMVAFYERALA
jgi:glycosyltransferase involved in cell wall biosynthesis